MIKKSLFNREYQKLLSAQDSRELAYDINTLSSLSILVSDASYPIRQLDEAVRYFRSLHLKAYGYMIVAQDSDIGQTHTEILYRKDCSWYGVPQQSMLIQWLSRKTDLLITIDPQQDPLIKYLTASSNCRLKCALDFGHERDVSIDIYVHHPKVYSVHLKEQCKAIYNTLEDIGVRPLMAS